MKNITIWIFRLIPAIILLQTLFYKFSAHPDSVAIFTKLHAEPFGRIFTGILELILSALILYPKTTRIGAIGALIVMTGAVFSHIVILGIETNNDGGKLFLLALTTALSCIILILKTIKK